MFQLSISFSAFPLLFADSVTPDNNLAMLEAAKDKSQMLIEEDKDPQLPTQNSDNSSSDMGMFIYHSLHMLCCIRCLGVYIMVCVIYETET